MKRRWISMLSLFLLSGCIAQGASLRGIDASKKQLQHAVDKVIVHQAEQAMKARSSGSYSVQAAPTSGPVLTLLVDEMQQVNRLIVHAEGYTQWIQLFDDRILCLTGDDGQVHAELLEDLSSVGDVQTIIQCALNPLSLVENRSFQRTSGAEAGSVQIATDNIDYWMKVSSEGAVDQIRLYLSEYPMMTMTYSDHLPVFPNIRIEQYPVVSDLLDISEENLLEKGFVKEDTYYTRIQDDVHEVMILNDFLMDYTQESETKTLRLIYDELTLTGIFSDGTLDAYCEVVLQGEKDIDEEIKCKNQEASELEKLFEKLKKEFQTHNFTS